MVKRWICTLLVLNIVFITGCWNYNEVEYFAIVSAMAIDKNPDGSYSMLIETVQSEPGKPETNFRNKLIEAQGETILDAVRNSISISDREFFWSHAVILIIGKDLASEGILPIMDWIIRDSFPRPTLHIFVSTEKTAREALGIEERGTRLLIYPFEDTVKSFYNLGKSPHIEAYQVANQIWENDFYTILPTIELVSSNNRTAVNITGSAYFKEDKLEGYLDPLETMMYLLIADQIKGGVFIVDMEEKESDNKVTLEIRRNRTKISTDFSNGEISMTVFFDTEVVIGEIDKSIDYTSKEGRQFLKEKTESFIEKEVKKFIEKKQKEKRIDIFNFSEHIKKNHPKLWKNIEKDWDTIYPDINIIVKSNIEIIGSGQVSSPIKIGD